MNKKTRDAASEIQRKTLARMTKFNNVIGASCAKQKTTAKDGNPPVDPCPLIWGEYQDALAEAAAWLALYGEVPCGQ